MAEDSKIAWTDHTFNPWVGCEKVSPGCQHCYAEALMRRWGRDFTKPKLTSDANWRKPRTWNRKTPGARVFTGSLCDVFDQRVPEDWRNRLFQTMYDTRALTWLVLTKRPAFAQVYPGAVWPINAWLGATVEDQGQTFRMDHLEMGPSPRMFLSCEPLLGPLDLGPLHDIGWVIVGGESGHHARPMDVDWVRGIRDQCQRYSVPFFFKQSGGTGKQAHDIPTLDGRQWTQTPWDADNALAPNNTLHVQPGRKAGGL